jgi:hypothetical protein
MNIDEADSQSGGHDDGDHQVTVTNGPPGHRARPPGQAALGRDVSAGEVPHVIDLKGLFLAARHSHSMVAGGLLLTS